MPGDGPDSARRGVRALQIAVMVSGHGRGSNLQAILDACASREIPAEVAVVIGTRSDAPAIERARNAGAPTVVISPKRFEGDDAAYGAALLNSLRSRGVQLLCLAGYMRMLPSDVVKAYSNRILNIHPALLPLFGGKGMYGENVHRAVLESGMKVSGSTVHIVDEVYDNGPIVVQHAIPVLPDDTPESLAARILPEEHSAYVEAIRLFAEDRVFVENGIARIRPAPR